MAGAPRLACPHCQRAVDANPMGRWFQGFQCPHCKGRLQFDARTNNLGILGGAFFAAMMLSAVMGRASWTPWFAAGCGVLWVAAMYLSYRFRGIVKA